jgi:uncharacterized protein (TIGR03435 family)
MRPIRQRNEQEKKMINHAGQSQRKTTARMLIVLMVLALDFMIGFAMSRQVQNPATSAGVPKWEAVSVKPCTNDVPGPDGRGGGAPGPNSSPDRFIVTCRPLLGFVEQAYITSTRGQLARRVFQIQGAPAWIESERYTISAKAEGVATRELMASVMLQQILEDRFKLKVHWDMRDVPGYVLTVARGGAKLRPFQGGCMPLDLTAGLLLGPNLPGPPSPGQERCPALGSREGPNVKIDAEGITLDMLTQAYLSGGFGRAPVVNKTGISGQYNFHLKYADPQRGVGGNTQSDVGLTPSLSAVLETLGLKLDAGKVPGGFLIIDHIERPTEN